MSRWAGKISVLMLIAAGLLESPRAWAQESADAGASPLPAAKADDAADEPHVPAPVLDTWGTNEPAKPPSDVAQEAQVTAEQSEPAEKTATEVQSEAHENRLQIDA